MANKGEKGSRSTSAGDRTERWLRPVAWLALAAVVVIAALLGWRRASPPQYCALGLVLLRDEETDTQRCCGRSQRVRAGRCLGTPTSCAAGMRITAAGCVAYSTPVNVDAGLLRVSPTDWEAASVVESRETEVSRFAIDRCEVVVADYERCVHARACSPIELASEPGLPVTGATRSEAERFCAWRGGRLPTSDEHAFAAMGSAGRRYPWGQTGAVCRRAAFGLAKGPCAFGATGPELAGTRPDGATPGGIEDLAGNVAEWTADVDPAHPRLAPVRGGSWQDSAAHLLRGWSQRWIADDSRSSAVGWRCAYPTR